VKFRKPECAEWSKRANARAGFCERDFCVVIVVGKSVPSPCLLSPLPIGPPGLRKYVSQHREFRFLIQSARYVKKVATFLLPSRRNETRFYLADLFRGSTFFGEKKIFFFPILSICISSILEKSPKCIISSTKSYERSRRNDEERNLSSIKYRC